MYVTENGVYKESPVHTVTENGDCRRKVRLSQKTATVALFKIFIHHHW